MTELEQNDDRNSIYSDAFRNELRSVYGTYGPGGKKTILTIVILNIENRILHIEKEWKEGEDKNFCIKYYKEAIELARFLRDKRGYKWNDILEYYGV